MQEQESILKNLLDRKKTVLAKLNRQQDRYHSASAEWALVSKELNELFESLESDRDTGHSLSVKKHTLPLPVDAAPVRSFGKSIHPKFGTVTFHKGLEIEAEQQSPVHAVLDGFMSLKAGCVVWAMWSLFTTVGVFILCRRIFLKLLSHKAHRLKKAIRLV